MVPDMPLYAGALAPRAHGFYAHTHSVIGLLTTDVVLGLVLWLAWRDVIRAPLTDALPDVVRRRAAALREPPPRDLAALALGVAAVAIGAASHVLIDEFTHAGRWGEANVAWLAQTHAGLRGTQWLQSVGGLGGLPVIGGALASACLRARPCDVERRRPAEARWVRWVPLAGAAAVSLAAAEALASGVAPAAVAYRAATQGVLMIAACALVTMLAWHAVTLRTPRTPAAPE